LPSPSQQQGDQAEDERDPHWDWFSQGFITLAFLYAVGTLCVYNINYEGNGERDSHWLEAPSNPPYHDLHDDELVSLHFAFSNTFHHQTGLWRVFLWL